MITFAMVNVFPLPVTPKSTWVRIPSKTPSVKLCIACGWSPVGSNFECNSNFISAINYTPFYTDLQQFTTLKNVINLCLLYHLRNFLSIQFTANFAAAQFCAAAFINYYFSFCFLPPPLLKIFQPLCIRPLRNSYRKYQLPSPPYQTVPLCCPIPCCPAKIQICCRTR